MEHLTDREIWEHVLTMTDTAPCLSLGDHDLGRYVAAAVLRFENTQYSPLYTISRELFDEFVDRASRFEREAVYRRVFRIVEAGESTPDVLRWYLTRETHLSLVARAAIDYSVLYRPRTGDPMEGPKNVLNLMKNPNTRCPAGLFSGLMLLGDDRVCRLLEPARRELEEDEVGVVCRNSSGYLCAATIEFMLDWLEEVEADGDDGKFGFVASGFVNQLRASRAPVVMRGRRRFPADPSGQLFENGLTTVPIADYAREIEPRLRSIADREPPPKVMPFVLAVWAMAASLSSTDLCDEDQPTN